MLRRRRVSDLCLSASHDVVYSDPGTCSGSGIKQQVLEVTMQLRDLNAFGSVLCLAFHVLCVCCVVYASCMRRVCLVHVSCGTQSCMFAVERRSWNRWCAPRERWEWLWVQGSNHSIRCNDMYTGGTYLNADEVNELTPAKHIIYFVYAMQMLSGYMYKHGVKV